MHLDKCLSPTPPAVAELRVSNAPRADKTACTPPNRGRSRRATRSSVMAPLGSGSPVRLNGAIAPVDGEASAMRRHVREMFHFASLSHRPVLRE